MLGQVGESTRIHASGLHHQFGTHGQIAVEALTDFER